MPRRDPPLESARASLWERDGAHFLNSRSSAWQRLAALALRSFQETTTRRSCNAMLIYFLFGLKRDAPASTSAGGP